MPARFKTIRDAVDFLETFTYPSNDDVCGRIDTHPSKIIGSGGYGDVISFEGCNDFLVKTASNEMSETPFEKSGDDVIIYDDQLHEFIMTNIVGRLFDTRQSAFFYSVPGIVKCDDDISTIIPRFAGDMTILHRINDKKRYLYNLDFCCASVIHAVLLLQREFRCNHRDLKFPNILMQPIGDVKWTDGKPLSSFKYIVLDFGDDRKMYFETRMIDYIPKIGDWGFANLYSMTIAGVNVFSDALGFTKDANGIEYGIPDGYTTYYDIVFFIAYLFLHFRRNDEQKMINYKKGDTFASSLARFVFDVVDDSDVRRYILLNTFINSKDSPSVYDLIQSPHLKKKTIDEIVKWYFSNPMKKYSFSRAKKDSVTISTVVKNEKSKK